MMTRIEDFFDHKWDMDCNQAIITEEDFMLLAQLPREV